MNLRRNCNEKTGRFERNKYDDALQFQQQKLHDCALAATEALSYLLMIN